jgi:putative redox protein
LCAALGACTAITLRMYAERKGWPLHAAHVDVRFRREDKVGAIARVLSFEGELDDAQRARLADIAERTPVTLTLKQGLAITTTLQ